VNRAVAAAGLAVSLLAVGGVLGLGFAENGELWPVFGACSYPSAPWHQAGLHAQAGADAPDPWSVEAVEASGLAFDNAALDERFDEGELELAAVDGSTPRPPSPPATRRWSRSSRGRRPRCSPVPPPTTSTSRPPSACSSEHDPGRRRHHRGLDPGAAGLGVGGRRGAFARFERGDTHRYQVEVDQLAVSEHVEAVAEDPPLGGEPDPISAPRVVGEWTVGSGGWSYR